MRMHRVTIQLAAWLLTQVITPISAQEMPPSNFLEQLGSRDYETRVLATEQLLNSEQIDLDQLATMYQAADSPEQRHRLAHVARHHYLSAVRQEGFRKPSGGALGIAHQAISHEQAPGVDGPAILVAETFPGFPAHGRLRVGDLLIGMNGEALPADLDINKAANLFTATVSRQPAGAEVTLWVLRGRERHQVTLRLASHDALVSMYQRNNVGLTADFELAWQEKFEQLFTTEETPTISRDHD